MPTLSSRCRIVGGIVALGSACALPAPADTGELPPELVLQGVRLEVYRGEALEAVGQARTASFRAGTGEVSAAGVGVRFLGAEPAGEVQLSAARVEGNLRDRTGEASGGVRLEDAAGTVGTAPGATFDGTARRAEGPGPVEVRGPGFTSRGEGGFVLHLASPGRLDLLGPVTTRAGAAP